MAMGILCGLIFVVLIKKFLEQFDNIKVANIQGAPAQKILLIILVMTVHSLTEGVGIGVSFGKSTFHAVFAERALYILKSIDL